MKLGLTRCVTASVLFCSMLSVGCKTTHSNSGISSAETNSGPYFQVWTAYRRRDISLQDFKTRWASVTRTDTQYQSLAPAIWSANETLARPFPDAVQLDSFTNEQDYLSHRVNETQTLLDLVEPVKSKNPQAIPVNGPLEAGQAYLVVNASGPWTRQNVVPVFLEATNPQSFLTSVSEYLQNQNAVIRNCHLQGLIASCGSNFCTLWIHEVGTERACSNLSADVKGFAKVVPQVSAPAITP